MCATFRTKKTHIYIFCYICIPFFFIKKKSFNHQKYNKTKKMQANRANIVCVNVADRRPASSSDSDIEDDDEDGENYDDNGSSDALSPRITRIGVKSTIKKVLECPDHKKNFNRFMERVFTGEEPNCAICFTPYGDKGSSGLSFMHCQHGTCMECYTKLVKCPATKFKCPRV